MGRVAEERRSLMVNSNLKELVKQDAHFNAPIFWSCLEEAVLLEWTLVAFIMVASL